MRRFFVVSQEHVDLEVNEVAEERTDLPARVIKRYANRKLYDTRASRYVTLNQISEYVKAGEDVRIIDNTSKEDLTSVTLAQILYERERQREPDERKDRSLRDLLREGRERLFETLKESPVAKLVQRVEDASAPHVDADAHAHDASASTGPKEPARRPSILAPREALDELGRMADEQWRSLLDGAMHTVSQLQGEVQRLHSRIEELESRLGARLGKREEPKSDESVDNPSEKSGRDSE